MYDHHVDDRQFWRYLSEINQLAYTVNDVDVSKLFQQIQEDLDDGKLSFTQYDKLIGELHDFGYDIK